MVCFFGLSISLTVKNGIILYVCVSLCVPVVLACFQAVKVQGSSPPCISLFPGQPQSPLPLKVHEQSGATSSGAHKKREAQIVVRQF